MNAPIPYWVVRDKSGYMVDVFDIGNKYEAECLASDYFGEYAETFNVSLEYLQGEFE